MSLNSTFLICSHSLAGKQSRIFSRHNETETCLGDGECRFQKFSNITYIQQQCFCQSRNSTEHTVSGFTRTVSSDESGSNEKYFL